ncbi:MAG: arylsulfatase [Bryobacterales bacterium]|nr:arylsulfatase [Bryobacterales bacterium]
MATTRRQFLGSLAAASVTPTAGTRPNIIVIMADDMGFSDTGCFGSEARTPNLDRLAAEGVRFTHFYNSARCCPSRASLITGLYAHQAGVGHMIRTSKYPAYQGYLNDRCATFAEVLNPAGYRTLMVGKWHVGEDRPHWPRDRGFQRYFGLISGASNYFRLEPGRKMALDDQPYALPSEGFYMTDAFSRQASEWITEYGGKPEPYFLYLAYTAPHWPLHALPDDIARYRGKYMKGWDILRHERHERQIGLGVVERRWPLTPRDKLVPAWSGMAGKDSEDLRMAIYAAQIDRMDQGIGRVLDAVRKTGKEENTLVLFLADNGACAEENLRSEKPGVPPGPTSSFTSYGRRWANLSNTPFRLYKHWVHEGGISTPLIARWPRGIRNPNRLIHQPGHEIDIMATVIDLAGAKYPSSRNGVPLTPLAGLSLRPVLEDRPGAGHSWLFWEHEGNCAVRHGPWKAVNRYPNRWELYNIEGDRTEMKDRAAGEQRRLNEMISRHAAWSRKVGVVPWDQYQAQPS